MEFEDRFARDKDPLARDEFLDRVKIPWQAMTVTFVEFCERFSYYGTTAVFVNFIQQPRPYGSRTGAIVENDSCYLQPGWDKAACTQPGGLGQDQRAATGLTVRISTAKDPNQNC